MTGELYGLFGPRSVSFLPLLWSVVGLIAGLAVARWCLSLLKKKTLVDEGEEEEEFDLELWHGALIHLRNHYEDYDQGVFMNELYRLLIDAMGAKYNADEMLETATKEQLEQFSFLEQKEKELLQTLYTPVFEAGDWTDERKNEVIDLVEHLVIGRDDLATHKA